MLTGSRDTSLIIWDALPWPPRTRGAPALPLATSPRRVLYGHDDGVRPRMVSADNSRRAKVVPSQRHVERLHPAY